MDRRNAEVQALPAYRSAAGVAGREDGRLLDQCSPPSRRAGRAAVACPRGRATRAGQPASEWLTELDWSEPVELGTFYRYAFARALQAVGLPVTTPARDGKPALQGVRLHDLRHSAAVAWLQAGVPVVQVSRWLGHAQPTITFNVYGDWVPETVDNPLPEPVARNVVCRCGTATAVELQCRQ